MNPKNSHPDPCGKDSGHASETPKEDAQSSKGKGKESSIVDRLRSSGQMLSRSMGSGAPNLSGLASSEKATSATAGGSGTPLDVLHDTSHARFSSGSLTRQREIFRGYQEATTSQSGFDEFIHGQRLQLPQDRQAQTPVLPGNSITECQTTDGAAVVDLLSQIHEFEMEPTQKDRDESLAPETSERLRQALFEGESQGLDWDNLLNFTPRFVLAPAENEGEARLHMGTTDSDHTREAWFDQWRDVLSSYNEEVWGDLGPLVEQAKREIVDSIASRDGNGNPGEGALGRLKMILSHVRGST